jgi:hypothetical protein
MKPSWFLKAKDFVTTTFSEFFDIAGPLFAGEN